MSQKNVARGGGALFADPGPDGFLHRSFLRGEGIPPEDRTRRPVVGICSSWSELNPCNAGLRTLAESVKRGVAAAGGLALEFPTISLSEPFTRPSSMYLRNLMSVDVEEMISSSPIDAVVLLGGCDKTVPAQLMGAISAGKPAVLVTAGPRPVSCWRGRATTIDDAWPLIERRRLGEVSDEEWREAEENLVTGVGTCNVLGTATTMAAVAEVLGFAPPGSALPPAADPRRHAIAERAGEMIVAAYHEDRRPSDLVTLASLENAFRVVCALGGSTNAVVHLEAIAGRAGLHLEASTLRAWAATTPLLAAVRPSGEHLLSDLEVAGGVPAVMRELAPLLDLGTQAADGRSWQTVIDAEEQQTGASAGSGALASLDSPLAPAGMAVLTGSLAPDGAVVKVSAASQRLLRHRGRAVVFDGIEDVNARIDDPDLPVDADSILVLRGLGVRGGPGMPEVAHVPIPAKLAREGVTDMVRVSDARMSGTSSGTVVLHVAPEAVVGGPLGLVRDGDVIVLDVEAGTIDLDVTPEELASRRTATPPPPPARGYDWIYQRHVLQPDRGCDFDFLRADFEGDVASPVTET
ncbi:dihydroxy-acid dehydratase [Streptomyces chartreusis]|uniref:Dihydroxy-acid dehydratase n=1 Tax=Streptomyces chartreusis TaxID=1969 RepID=A0A7H8T1H0_STRCX|nr:dihydroxy-acid dehydratase [Streptomyces chartreusis]QKZ17297.1 dihydroxy-acid dehydratase [Streptomyces chartreusis]